MNEFRIVGYMGADAELRSTGASGKTVAKLRVAVNPRPYKKDGEYVNPPAQWFHVDVYLPKTAEWAGAKLTKGSHVLIVGELRPRSYEQAGETRWTMDLVVNDRSSGHRVEALSLKGDEQAPAD